VHARPQRAGRAPVRTGIGTIKQGGERLLERHEQALELRPVPGRHILPRRHPVLDQQVPQLGPLLREGDVGFRQPAHALFGRAGGIRLGKPLGQPVEQAGFDRQQEVVEILEHVVKGAGRVADALGDLARR